ncbi:MAG: hypothetical protein K1X50_01310 [Candidatus Promineofilum sp.]|nr:hypothetical protein [Promineifilum sp.]MCW5863172.1 hypothetical protein [Anaerolineae bacterium]
MSQPLIDSARAVLSSRSNPRWLIGGSASGKSTIARALGARTGIAVYDMDEAVFGRFRFDPVRHPATTAWFTAANPLAWMLSLPWAAFDALYRANNAEMLDLLADDLAGRPDAPLLIDGGITHPSVLTQVIPAGRIVCLETDDARRRHEWATAPGRAGMKAEILALPDGAALWERFLEYDRQMTATLGRESRAYGIQILRWDESHTVEQISEQVLYLLN